MTQDIQVVTADERAAGLPVVGTMITVLHQGRSGDVTYQTGEEGTGPPPHHHPWDECFFVLSGSVVFDCGGATRTCGPGDFVQVPAGAVHGFQFGPEGGAMLEFTGPGSRSAAMFTAIARETPPGPPDVPKLVEVLDRHGAELAVPTP